MSASDAAPLPRLGEVFFDVRGDSRSMRLSWYADTGVAVFSIWQGGMCTGTFRLPMSDLDRMIEILQRGPQRRRSGGPDASRGEPERYEQGGYGPGDYGDGSHDDGGYGPGDYGDGGHDDGGYGPGDYRDRGHDDGGYGPGDYGDGSAGYEPGGKSGGHGPQAYGPEAYGPDGYGPAGPANPSRRPGGVHRSAGYADPAGFPDPPGYADPVPDDRSPAGTRRPDLPTAAYRRPAGSYQPEGYQTDGYQTDGYQTGGYPADGRQTEAYQPETGDYAAAAESDPTGYGQERFVPPYVRARSDGYPNDNPVSGQGRRRGGSRPAYPADRGGISREADGYSLPDRAGPGYTDGSDYRLAADTAVSARDSDGSHGSQQTRSHGRSQLPEADLPMTGSRVSQRDNSGIDVL